MGYELYGQSSKGGGGVSHDVGSLINIPITGIKSKKGNSDFLNSIFNRLKIE